MACFLNTHDFHYQQVCLNFTLGPCPRLEGKTCPSNGSANKRKSSNETPIVARKKARGKKSKKERNWGYTTEFTLYDDPWKIKKELKGSDLGNLSRLLLPKDLVEDLVIPVLSPEAQRDVETEKGTKITIWDLDTQSVHYLVFKHWISSGSYVFIDNWNKDFVKRRGLKKGDEIGLHWSSSRNCFDFSVLLRA